MGRSRGGLTTKIHALVDAEGRLVDRVLTAGQAPDGKPAVAIVSFSRMRSCSQTALTTATPFATWLRSEAHGQTWIARPQGEWSFGVNNYSKQNFAHS